MVSSLRGDSELEGKEDDGHLEACLLWAEMVTAESSSPELAWADYITIAIYFVVVLIVGLWVNISERYLINFFNVFFFFIFHLIGGLHVCLS